MGDSGEAQAGMPVVNDDGKANQRDISASTSAAQVIAQNVHDFFNGNIFHFHNNTPPYFLQDLS